MVPIAWRENSAFILNGQAVPKDLNPPISHTVFHRTATSCVYLHQMITCFTVIAVIRPNLVMCSRKMETFNVKLAHDQIQSHHTSRVSSQPLRV